VKLKQTGRQAKSIVSFFANRTVKCDKYRPLNPQYFIFCGRHPSLTAALHGCAAELFEPWMASSQRQNGFAYFFQEKSKASRRRNSDASDSPVDADGLISRSTCPPKLTIITVKNDQSSVNSI
jgi:hypothetical protein